MKKYMLLHVGFEPPTSEIIAAWETWFASIAERQVKRAGFAGGREISHDGVRDLPWDEAALTGFNIIEAENLDEAEKIAQSNPFITAIRVYELR